MGLDMYLTAERYFGSYMNPNERNRIVEALEGDHPPIQHERPSATVQIDLAYWRKANQVHNWFVENVQGGEDNCQKYFVSIEDLRSLVATCEGLLVKRSLVDAEEELPTQSGFFFGDTEYGEYYWECVEDTVNQLRPVLDWFDADEKRRMHWDLHYRSSW
jgi:hypothetical protein